MDAHLSASKKNSQNKKNERLILTLTYQRRKKTVKTKKIERLVRTLTCQTVKIKKMKMLA